MSEPISINKQQTSQPTRFDNDPNNAQGALQYVLQVVGEIDQKLFDMQSEASAQQNKTSYELMVKGYEQKTEAITHELKGKLLSAGCQIAGSSLGILGATGGGAVGAVRGGVSGAAEGFGLASQASRLGSDTVSSSGQLAGAHATRDGEQENANAQLTQGTVGVSQDATARFRSLAQASVDQLNNLNQTIAQSVKNLNEAVRM